MEELKTIDEQFNALIHKREKDIKACNNNIEEFTILINRLKQIDIPIIYIKKVS